MKQRELKFRAWDVVDKVMKDSFTLRSLVGGYDCGYRVDKDLPFIDEEDENNPDTIIMQFTGLRDKDGKEIYEGDIIQKRMDGDDSRILETIVMEWVPEQWTEEGFMTGFSQLWTTAEQYEIIGNVWENPELIEQ